MVLLICAVLAIGAIGFTLIVREQDIPPAPVENPELVHLESKRQVLYENLKDLQFEFHQGKLSEEDYQSLKQGFLNELASTMAAIDRLKQQTIGKGVSGAGKKSSRGAVQRSPKASEAQASASASVETADAIQDVVSCPSCGTFNPSSNRFCGSCGKPLQQ